MATAETTSVKDISLRAQSYNMEGLCVDGNDVLQVYRAARAAIQMARRGDGPTLIEAKTFRLKGHYVGDPQKYRDPQEAEARWRDEPIGRFERLLLERQVLSEEARRAIWRRYEAEIEEAVRFAESSPHPEPAEALTDLFVVDTGYDY